MHRFSRASPAVSSVRVLLLAAAFSGAAAPDAAQAVPPATPAVHFHTAAAAAAETNLVVAVTLIKDETNGMTSGELRLGGTATPGEDFSISGLGPFAGVATVPNPEAAANESFGAALIRLGDRFMAVGAPLDAGAAGAVHLYEWTPAGMELRAAVTNPAPAPGAQFGMTLAAAGPFRFVVGAPGAAGGGNDVGAAFVYEWDGTNFLALGSVTNPTPAAADRFGAALAGFQDGRFLVGVPGDDAGGTDEGTVYAYQVSGTSVVALATITNPAPGGAGLFGSALGALEGSRFAAGAPGADRGAANAGAAYVYDWPGGVPVLLAAVTNPAPAADDAFGSALAGAGTNGFVVGAALDDGGMTNAGAAYAYAWTNGWPILVAAIANPAPAREDQFGASVAAFGEGFLVGAPRDDLGTTNAGAACSYAWVDGLPQLVATLPNPAPAKDDQFGTALLDLGAGLCAVGAPYDAPGGIRGGAVHLIRTATEPGGLAFALPIAMTSRTFQIALTNDLVAEPAETVSLVINSGTVLDGIASGPDTFTLTILANAGLASPVTLPVGATNGAAVQLQAVITNDGGYAVTARGFIVATLPMPGVAITNVSAGSGSGTYSAWTTLSPDLRGFAWAYASNAAGLAMGEPVAIATAPLPPGSCAVRFTESGWTTPEVAQSKIVWVEKTDPYSFVSGEIGTCSWPGVQAALRGSDYDVSNDTPRFVEAGRWTNPVPVAGNAFGYAMASIDSNRFVVAAPRDDLGASNAGACWIYELHSGLPVLVGLATNPQPAADDAFGSTLSAVGTNRFIVGAPSCDAGTRTNAGAAFLFEWTSTSTLLRAVVTNPVPAVGDSFSYSLAGVGTDKFVVGTGNSNAYLYACTATSVTRLATLSGSGNFGYGVGGLGSNRFLVGAPANSSGYVHLYEWNGTQVVTVTSIANPGNANYGRGFGRALTALSTTRFVIGAPSNTVSQQLDGAAYLYECTGTTATLLGEVPHPTSTLSDNFGYFVVALSSNRFAVGEPHHDGWGPGYSSFWDSGACHLFEWNGSKIVSLAMLTNVTPTFLARFGFSAALMDGGWIAISTTEEVPPPAYANTSGPGRFSLFLLDSGISASRFELPGAVMSNAFRISVVADDLEEPTEHALLTLDHITGGVSRPPYVFDLAIVSNAGLPTVYTDPVGAVGPDTAHVSGLVTSNGGSQVDLRGFIVTALDSPDAFSRRLNVGGGEGPFAATLTDLAPATRYRLWAFASNEVGIRYGNRQEFTTEAAEPLEAHFSQSDATADERSGTATASIVKSHPYGLVIGELASGGTATLDQDYTLGDGAAAALLGLATNLFTASTSRLGSAMALVAPNALAVGAPEGDWSNRQAGAVFVYRIENGAPLLVSIITNPAPTAGAAFGCAIARAGPGWFAVGASGDDLPQTNCGALYWYAWDGTEAQPQGSTPNPFPAKEDRFGTAVTAFGSNMIAVGALGGSTGAVAAGSVYLFTRNATGATLLASADNPTPTSGDAFGSALADLGNDLLAVGAPRDGSVSAHGCVYILKWTGAALVPLACVSNPTLQVNGAFGASVARLGDSGFVVGAPGDWGRGDVHVFDWTGTSAVLRLSLTNATSDFGDGFGSAVTAIGSNRFAVGASSNDTGAANSGVAYLYELCPTGVIPMAQLALPTPSAAAGFGQALTAIDAARLAVGVPQVQGAGPGAAALALYAVGSSATSPVFAIAGTETSAAIRIQVIMDGVQEPEETALLAITNLIGATPAPPSAFALTIEANAGAPVVATTQAIPTGAFSAQLGGAVSGDGGAPVLARGFIYGTSAAPAAAQSVLPAGAGLGSFSARLEGLQPWTRYYVRAFASNDAGLALGEPMTLDTAPAPLPAVHLHLAADFVRESCGTYTAVVSKTVPFYLVSGQLRHSGSASPGADYTIDGAPASSLAGVVTNPMPANGAVFGSALATLSSNRFIVGADSAATGAASSGAVFVYEATAPGYALAAMATNPTAIPGEAFGLSIATWGPERFLVGASSRDEGGTDVGAAYLYALSGGVARLDAVVAHPEPAPYSYFGHALAFLSESNFLVGAYGANVDGYAEAGAVYGYSWDGTYATRTLSLGNPVASNGDAFGWSIAALDHRTFLVGAHSDDVPIQDSGSVYLYEWDGVTAILRSTITNPAPMSWAYFGYTVASLASNRFVIGAAHSDIGARRAGAAYLFGWDGTQVSLLAMITNPAPNAEESFASCVAALATNRFVVGCEGDVVGGIQPGGAYAYEWNGTSAVLIAAMTNPAAMQGDNFGFALAGLSAHEFLVAAPHSDQQATEGGTVYDLRLAEATDSVPFSLPGATTSATVVIHVAADSIPEPDEFVTLALDDLYAATPVAPASFTLTILSNTALPEVETDPVVAIGTYTAALGGVVSADGGSPVTDRGFALNQAGSPTVLDTKLACGSGTGSFGTVAGALAPAGTYFVRAYASNSAGIAYGSARTFTTGTQVPEVYFSCATASVEEAAGTYIISLRKSAPHFEARGRIRVGGTATPDADYSIDGAIATGLLATVTNTFASTNDGFGVSATVLDSSHTAVGACSGTSTGKVQVLTWQDVSPSFACTITNPSPAIGSYFGWAVAALSSNRLAVGAPSDDTGANDSGVIHLFNLDGSSATLSTTITNPTPASSDAFGWILRKLAPNLLLTSAHADDTASANAGAVYLYKDLGTQALLVTTITNPAPSPTGYFGWSLGVLDTNRFLVGARDDAQGAGSVFLYDWDGIHATRLATIHNPRGAQDDHFGWSISPLSDSRFVVGASQADLGGTNAGAAYLFDAHGSNITLLATLTNPAAGASTFFGDVVEGVTSNAFAVHASPNGNGAPDIGMAYLYRCTGTQVALFTTLANPGSKSTNRFATTLTALSPHSLLVGAPRQDRAVTNEGVAYLFSALPETDEFHFSLPGGVTSAEFVVHIVADEMEEPDETVELSITGTVNATAAAPEVFTLTLLGGPGVPSVETLPPAPAGAFTGQVSGWVTADGGSPVTGRGIVYATAAPALDAGTLVDGGSGTGVFSAALSGLQPWTRYFVRAYASNAMGTGWGSLQTFDTLPSPLPEVRFASAGGVAEEGTAHAVTVVKSRPYYAVSGELSFDGSATPGDDYEVSPAAQSALLATASPFAPPADARFGATLLALDDSRFVVGAPEDGPAAHGAGSVSVMAWDGRTNSLRASVARPGGSAGDCFGCALAALTPQLFLVGARGVDDGAVDAGAVYVCSCSDSNADVLLSVAHPAPSAGAAFGASLAARSPALFLVGAPRDDGAAGRQGAAYLFAWGGTSATLRVAFSNPAPAVARAFGAAVAMPSTNLLIIGAPGEEADRDSSGAAYIYTWDGTSAQMGAALTNPAPFAGAGFGASLLALDTNLFVVGAPASSAGPEATGLAFIYAWNGAQPTRLATLTNPAPERGNAFGVTLIAIPPNRFAVGAPGEDTAFLYEWDGVQARLTGLVTNPTPAPDCHFGQALSCLTPSLLLAGVPDAVPGTACLFALATSADRTVFALPADTTSMVCTINVRSDGVAEPAETVRVALTNVTRGLLVAPTLHTLDITDMGAAATVETEPVDGIGSSTAAAHGVVSSSGGSTVTERGFLLGLGDAPSEADRPLPAGGGTGAFTLSLTNLEPGTRYHVRAYAHNAAGDAYGEPRSFTTDAAPIPEVGFLMSADTIFEDAGAYTVTVRKTLPQRIASGEIQFGGTASPLDDYHAASGPMSNVLARVDALDTDAAQRFGWTALTLATNRVAVSQPGDHVGGSVGVFEWNGEHLLRAEVLRNPSPAACDEFGAALARLSAQAVAVGAPGDNGGATDAGAVHIYAEAGTLHPLVMTLMAPVPVSHGQFGAAIAAQGPACMLVGEPGAAEGAGEIHLFDCSGPSPVHLLSATNPTPGSPRFGAAICALGTNLFAVGAPADGETASGRTHLFAWNGASLTCVGEIINSTPTPGDSFGSTLAALEPSRLAIGAPGRAGTAIKEGCVHLYTVSSSASALLATLPDPEAGSFDFFGWSICALSSNRFAVGAAGDNAGIPQGGAVHLYDWTGTSAVRRATIGDSSGAPGAFFGSAVAALAPDRLLIGAALDDRGATDGGTAELLAIGPSTNSLYFVLPNAVTTATFVLSVTNDETPEPVETVHLSMTSLRESTQGVPSAFTLSIIDLQGDDDGDAIPTAWEMRHGLFPFASNAPTANADGDWMTDFEEYLADTDPTNPASFFPAITWSNRPAAGASVDVGRTSTGRLYRLQWTTNLLAAPQVWVPWGTEVPGTGSNVSFAVTNDQPGRAYRSGVRPR